MIIETERLILKDMSMEDAEDLLRLHSDPLVQKYTGEAIITSIEAMRDRIKKRTTTYKKDGFGRWITILKDGMQFVGWSGLAYLPEFDEVDIGYRFLQDFWGRGLATEASNGILDYAFDDLKLKRIIAIAMKDNLASIRVMEKIGMQFEKYAPYDPGGEDVAWYWCDKGMIERVRANH